MTTPIGGIPTFRVTPPTGTYGPGAKASDFGSMLKSAVQSAVATGQEAESQSVKAITGGGNVTEVATALSRAELTLQTASAVRDRMLQAYQDIMRIQI